MSLVILFIGVGLIVLPLGMFLFNRWGDGNGRPDTFTAGWFTAAAMAIGLAMTLTGTVAGLRHQPANEPHCLNWLWQDPNNANNENKVCERWWTPTAPHGK